MQEVQIHEFSNGIRLLHHRFPSNITHCGFAIDVGSRDENHEEMGMAHFIEHMFFKGTTKRRAIHILNRLEFVGGELNAYTVKDKTCVYAAVGSDNFTRALELLCDVIFNSNFPQKEMEKEKKVIHEEIDMYLDSPEENIMDVFQEQAFKGNSLGFNILGTHQTLNSFDQKRVTAFFKKWYIPQKMVFVYNGKRTFKQVIKTCEHYFDAHPGSNVKVSQRITYDKKAFTSFDLELPTPHIQSYLVLGGLCYNNKNPKRLKAALLMNILGGPGLNSKLNLAIREKHGYAYDVEAGYQAMADIGMYHIFVGTDKKYLGKIQSIINREINGLKNTGLSLTQLHRYKNQFKGQVLMAEEHRSNISLAHGNMLLDEKTIEPLNAVFAKLDAVTSSDLMETANEIFHSGNMSRLVFVGEDKI